MRSNTDFSNRLSFDLAANDYDAARPTYPTKLFDDIVSYADIKNGDRVLEIGAGSGQATLALAERGFHVTAIEPGPKLAELAKQKHRSYKNAEVILSDFENWVSEGTVYKCAVSANAFHWVDPAVGYKKLHEVLVPGGSIGFFWNFPALGKDVYQRLSEIVSPFSADLLMFDPAASQVENVKAGKEQLLGTGLFENVREMTYNWDDTLSASTFSQLLNSYANYASLPAPHKTTVLTLVEEMIEKEFSGFVKLSNVAYLRLARTRDE